MKAVKSTLQFIGRTYLPFRAALQVDNIKNSVKDVYKVGRNVFTFAKAEQSDASFEAAMARLSLTELDIQARYENCKRIFSFFAVLAIVLLCYSLYLFSTKSFNAGLLCTTVTLLFSVCAFKYHFWMFQIRTRKLGCTLGEWSASVFGGEAH